MELWCHTGNSPCPPPSVLKVSKVFPTSAERSAQSVHPFLDKDPTRLPPRTQEGAYTSFFGSISLAGFSLVFTPSAVEGWVKVLGAGNLSLYLEHGPPSLQHLQSLTHSKLNHIYVYETGVVPLQDLVDFQRMSQRILALRYFIGFDYSL